MLAACQAAATLAHLLLAALAAANHGLGCGYRSTNQRVEMEHQICIPDWQKKKEKNTGHTKQHITKKIHR